MKDEFHIKGMTEEGGLVGTRVNDEGEKEALVTPMVQGQALIPGMEMVRLEPGGDASVLSITSLYKAKGPPQVASKQYRDNYDQIFGGEDAKTLN